MTNKKEEVEEAEEETIEIVKITERTRPPRLSVMIPRTGLYCEFCKTEDDSETF